MAASVLWVLACFGACANQTTNATAKRLVLERIADHQLPTRYDFGGAEITTGNRIAAWSRSQGALWIYEVGQSQLLSIPGFSSRFRLGPLGVTWLSDSTIGILARRGPKLESIVFDVTNNSLRGTAEESQLPDSSELVVATRMNRGWAYVTRSSNDVAALYLNSDRSGRPIWTLSLLPFKAHLPDSLARLDLLAKPSRKGILITLRWKPFKTFLVDSLGETRLTLQPPDELAACAPGIPCSQPILASLSVLELDQGYVQSLADLKSERRYLVLYDIQGEPIRVSQVEGAFGLVSIGAGTGRALAFTDFGGERLLVYKWRWSR